MAAYMAKNLHTRSRYIVDLFSTITNKPRYLQCGVVSGVALEHSRPRFAILTASFVKKAGKGQPIAVVDDEPIEVSKNPEDLVKYCVGSNYFVEGTDVELKPDSEYPDWLWDLHIGKPKKLEELDPEKKEYWRKLRKLNMKRNNRLAKLKKF